MDIDLAAEILDKADPRYLQTLLNQIQDGVACVDRSRRILLWNRAAERLTGYETGEAVGRVCAEDLPLHLDAEGATLCRGRCPVEDVFKDGTIRTLACDLRHKDGYRVPAEVRVMPILDRDGAITGALEIFAATTPRLSLPLPMSELERVGFVDGDTGIPDRRYLEMQLRVRLEEFQKFGLPFGLIYADIDNYNRLLEKFGRFNAGKALRMIARTLHKNVRYFDIVGRWNTEEFLIILLNIDENRLDFVANKLRLLVEESYIMVETGALGSTVSMGATVVQRYDTVESLLKRVEQLMMHSKWRGRNTVSLSFVKRESA